MPRQKYTYIPKEEIASITTFNNVDFENDDLLDGAYVRGRKKFARGGKFGKEYKLVPKIYIGVKDMITTDYDNMQTFFGTEDEAIAKAKELAKSNPNFLRVEIQRRLKTKTNTIALVVGQTPSQTLKPLEIINLADGGEIKTGDFVNINGRKTKVLDTYTDKSFGAKTIYIVNIPIYEGVKNSQMTKSRYIKDDETGELRKIERKDFVMADGGTMARGGRTKSMSLQEQAQSMVGSDWFKLDKNDQDKLVAEFVADGTIGMMYAAGGGVAEAGIEVKFTLSNGKVVTKIFASQSEADDGIADFYIENDVDDLSIKELKAEPKPEAKPKKSLFKMAEEEPKATKSKSSTKPEVRVDGIEGDIAEYDRINQKIKMLQTEKEVLAAKLKDVGKEKFIELYELKNRRPENFNLADGDEEILYMVQDKYIKVSPEKAALLRSYGKGLVETVTTYEFDKDVVEKKVGDTTIGDIVSELIMESSEIPEDDKARLIKATVETRVPKGTIDRLMDYPNPEEVFNLIEPIQALK